MLPLQVSLTYKLGEVFLGNEVSIWHGTVIRGDINAVMYFLFNQGFIQMCT